ncbi:MAG: glycosyltransferase N-terminal domain-containing protein [Candidatus Alcyoniella australis]|nr:glycosyltransferase N-terminal domain-containing protein [Candidatus Alcyoniella australis]
MIRALYNLLWYVAALVLIPTWAVGALLRPRWRRGALERLGLISLPADCKAPLHVHAASVGEVRAAEPLIQALRARGLGPLLISTSTPEGRQAATDRWGDEIPTVLFPFDFRPLVQIWLRRAQPRITILVETELWPEMIWAHRDHAIPLALVSGRLSDRSYPRYRMARPGLRSIFAAIEVKAVQTTLHAARMIRIGAKPTSVFISGNAKFDSPIATAEQGEAYKLALDFKGEGLLLIGASTHQGEETACGRALLAAREAGVQCRLLVAPRHLERVSQGRSDLEALGLSVDLRSTPGVVQNADVLVLDTVGELTSVLGLADVCFVGGSLARVGGHNVLEPAAQARAVLVGPHTQNFVSEISTLQHAGALCTVRDGKGLADVVVELLSDPVKRDTMGQAGQLAVRSGSGAVDRTLSVLARRWPEIIGEGR